VASTPTSRPSENESNRNEHGEPAVKEVLAHLGFGPAFRGILQSLDSTEIDDADTSHRVEQHLLVTLNTARWIGVLLEARYGSAQVKFNWHADPAGLPMLAIEDDPWEEDPREQPRLVNADEHGRYALADYWDVLTDEQAADWLINHGAVLDELTATEPGPNAPTAITDYLQLGWEPRDFDPDHHIRGIRQALDHYPDRQFADPIVDVITDPDLGPEPESGIGVAVFLNGRYVPTGRTITLGSGTSAAAPHRDVIYAAIELAEALLTPPAAALVRGLLELRVPAPTSSWPSFE
jgi:hypothetical protein